MNISPRSGTDMSTERQSEAIDGLDDERDRLLVKLAKLDGEDFAVIESMRAGDSDTGGAV